MTLNDIMDHPWIKEEKLNKIEDSSDCTFRILLSDQKSTLKPMLNPEQLETIDTAEKIRLKEEESKEKVLTSLSIVN